MIPLLIVIVAASLWAQDSRDRDTVVGNLQLEWMGYPSRMAPDTLGVVLLPGIIPPYDDYQWPTALKWISSERLMVVYCFTQGVAIELYDTAGTAQLAGYYNRSRRICCVDQQYAANVRMMKNGQLGVWGCGYYRHDTYFNDVSFPYPIHFQLDTALRLDVSSVQSDTTLRSRTKVRVYFPDYLMENANYAKDFVLSHDGETFDGSACWILPDAVSPSWRLMLYSEDLRRRIFSREYPLPYSALIRDTMNRDSIIYLSRPPYAIRQTQRGIAGRSVTVTGERVIVFFGGENFEDVRAIRLPAADVNLEYFVEDGYVVDFALIGRHLVISKVWENGMVEWQRFPINPFVFGLNPPEYGAYRIRKSRWGGWYVSVYSASPVEPRIVSMVVRVNDHGGMTGYYHLRGPIDRVITDVAEHFADSSFYALGTREKKLVLLKFRFRPSDTTSISGEQTPEDTVSSVSWLKGREELEVYPQPVRRGEQLRVVAMADVEAVEVWTLDGRRVVGLEVERSGEVAGVSMDVPAGVYVVQVRSSGGRQQRGLVMVMP
jgi:hypothetical protein